MLTATPPATPPLASEWYQLIDECDTSNHIGEAEALNPKGFKKIEEPCGSKAGRVATGPERAFGFQWGGLAGHKRHPKHEVIFF